MLYSEPQKLPLEMTQLQKVLESKSKKDTESPELFQEPMFFVSYKDSTLKGKFFINYVANLKLSIKLHEGATDIDKEERFELLKEYMTGTNLAQINTLNDVVAVMLLEAKGADFEEEVWLNKEERKEFAQENKELLNDWSRFLESILIGMPFCVEDYAKTIGKDLIDNDVIEVITDANIISKNVALLLEIPGFLENFLSFKLEHKPALYEAQWFEPVFSGHSLMTILQNGDGTMFAFMVGLMESWFEPEDYKKLFAGQAA
jgi:hypothetical protein